MRNKKVVRLTESQLHNIIAESVSQILMELDPRTYASAADKAKERGNNERSDKFRSAAANTFEKDFGNDKYSMDSANYGVKSSSHDRHGIETEEYYDPSIDQVYRKETMYPTDKVYKNPREFDSNMKIKRNSYDGGKNIRTQYDIANQMANGSGKYIKGKGWQ